MNEEVTYDKVKTKDEGMCTCLLTRIRNLIMFSAATPHNFKISGTKLVKMHGPGIESNFVRS